MTLEKNGKTYDISECKNHWSVRYTDGGLSVTYEVAKDICENAEELAAYVQSNDMF